MGLRSVRFQKSESEISRHALRRFWLAVIAFLVPVLRVAAQATDQPEMADALRQSGKIYVVVAVITVVLAGLLAYLISLDRKLTRLEKEVRE